MRERLRVFMLGRNGIDKLAIGAIAVATVLELLFTVFSLNTLRPISYLFVIYAGFRILSKNVAKRREENYRFTRIWADIRRAFSELRTRRAQSGEYKFFTCPACKGKLRVPRGKGKLKITCARCGQRFDGRT